MLVGAFVVLLGYAARERLWPATPVTVVPTVVRPVQQTGGGVSVTAPGWVEADPFAISVSALTDGIVQEVLVLEGQVVKKGDVVVRLVPDDARLAVAAAEAEVRQAQAALELAKATLAAAKSDWDNPIERRRAVDAAQAMLEQAQGDLARLPAEVAAEQAKLEELADAAKRAEEAGESTSKSERVQSKLRLAAQREILSATAARRPAMEARIRQLEAELLAATRAADLRVTERKALDEATAEVAQAEAMLQRAKVAADEAKLRLQRMEIKSPADGVILNRLSEPGSKLMISDGDARSATAVWLYDPRHLQVRVDIPLADAAQVAVGQAAKVVVGVLPDRSFDGKVTRIVHEADIQRNTLQVKVAIDDPAPELKPEMLARVKFLAPVREAEAGKQRNQVFVPQSLVRREGNAATVWVVDQGRNVAIHRQVTLGEVRVEDWIAVEEGLQPGDLIIASDTAALSDGQRVRVTGEGQVASAGTTPQGGNHGAH